jgi:hypothetical protein
MVRDYIHVYLRCTNFDPGWVVAVAVLFMLVLMLLSTYKIHNSYFTRLRLYILYPNHDLSQTTDP